MMMTLAPKFVKYIPSTLEEGTIYISREFGTAIHVCVCGCGNQVVTPLSPEDWQLTVQNNSISLYPSIGNWNFKCKSHYWIRNSKIIWVSLDKTVAVDETYNAWLLKIKFIIEKLVSITGSIFKI